MVFLFGDFLDPVERDLSQTSTQISTPALDSADENINFYMDKAGAGWGQWTQYADGLIEGVSEMNCSSNTESLGGVVRELNAVGLTNSDVEVSVLEYFHALESVATNCVALEGTAKKMDAKDLGRGYRAQQIKWNNARLVALANGWTGSCAVKNRAAACI